jgi:transcription elongation factor GreA
MRDTTPSIPLTTQALAKYKKEFADLTIERKEVVKRLSTAREMGDLSENGAYKYAKIELGNVSRRLRELSHILKYAVIIKPSGRTDLISLGSQVSVLNAQTHKKMEFMLVGAYEADPQNNKISIESPLGLALMNRKVGEQVKVTAPAGTIIYSIEKIA